MDYKKKYLKYKNKYITLQQKGGFTYNIPDTEYNINENLIDYYGFNTTISKNLTNIKLPANIKLSELESKSYIFSSTTILDDPDFNLFNIKLIPDDKYILSLTFKELIRCKITNLHKIYYIKNNLLLFCKLTNKNIGQFYLKNEKIFGTYLIVKESNTSNNYFLILTDSNSVKYKINSEETYKNSIIELLKFNFFNTYSTLLNYYEFNTDTKILNNESVIGLMSNFNISSTVILNNDNFNFFNITLNVDDDKYIITFTIKDNVKCYITDRYKIYSIKNNLLLFCNLRENNGNFYLINEKLYGTYTFDNTLILTFPNIILTYKITTEDDYNDLINNLTEPFNFEKFYDLYKFVLKKVYCLNDGSIFKTLVSSIFNNLFMNDDSFKILIDTDYLTAYNRLYNEILSKKILIDPICENTEQKKILFNNNIKKIYTTQINMSILKNNGSWYNISNNSKYNIVFDTGNSLFTIIGHALLKKLGLPKINIFKKQIGGVIENASEYVNKIVFLQIKFNNSYDNNIYNIKAYSKENDNNDGTLLLGQDCFGLINFFKEGYCITYDNTLLIKQDDTNNNNKYYKEFLKLTDDDIDYIFHILNTTNDIKVIIDNVDYDKICDNLDIINNFININDVIYIDKIKNFYDKINLKHNLKDIYDKFKDIKEKNYPKENISFINKVIQFEKIINIIYCLYSE